MALSHIDSAGNAIMVDVCDKPVTQREATAAGHIRMNSECFATVSVGTNRKGDILGIAQVAGIMATKRTPELIPLCHQLNLLKTSVRFTLCPDDCTVRAECTVQCEGQTGVEMEALTGVSVALLTVYDMCKAIDKEMMIAGVHLVEKKGGKSGVFIQKKGRAGDEGQV